MAVATALLELIWTLNKDESEHYCLPDISITGGVDEGGRKSRDVQVGHRFLGILSRKTEIEREKWVLLCFNIEKSLQKGPSKCIKFLAYFR